MTETTLPPRDDIATPAYPPVAAPPSPPATPTLPARGPRGWLVVLAAALVSALVAGGVTTALVSRDADAPPAAGVPAPQPAAADPEAGAEMAGGIAEVAAAVSPSVVHIAVAGPGGQGSGSGVILRADGYVLTNAHVIDGAQQVQVTLPDGTVHDAEVVGADVPTDLGVVRIPDLEGELPVPQFASQTPRVGDPAVAIGSPFGLEGSVTSGIISALNRSLPGRTTSLANMIQTDAAINPGNSGGALVNGAGQVIGINTAILSPSGSNDGIGFAIPITSALPTAEQLIEQGFVEHGQLGVQGQDVDPTAAELYDLGVEAGALVVAVNEGSAAAQAGLQRGDIITGFDDTPIRSFSDLVGQVTARQPGDEVTLEVVRDREPLELQVTLGTAPTQTP